jgi:hypothetical protein
MNVSTHRSFRHLKLFSIQKRKDEFQREAEGKLLTAEIISYEE